ncbi:hypothetical protein MRX96_044425, partial [Rhipicephalus microplus]
VTRVDYSVDPGGAMRAFSIERSCSEHCTTECVAVGERLRLYMCRSCCAESLCNTGNEARALLEEGGPSPAGLASAHRAPARAPGGRVPVNLPGDMLCSHENCASTLFNFE